MDGDAAELTLRERFLIGMSHAASTVNVVTTDGAAARAGVTVSAMSSVSADTPKPTLLVCVHHEASGAAAIRENGVFCVNVLRDDQAYIANTFAGRYADVEDRFSCAEWTTQVTGAPRASDPLVAFDCTLVSQERVGTHHVFIGEVEDVYVGGRGSPLIYSNRAYGSAWRIDQPLSIDAGREASQRKLSIGCFHTFGPSILPGLIARIKESATAIDVEIFEGDQRRLLESLQTGQIELALLYDIDLPSGIEGDPLIDRDPYILLAEDHPLAAQSELTPADLAPHSMVLLDTAPNRDYVESIMNAASVDPRIEYRSMSLEMVRGLVGHGLGYAVLATKPASTVSYDGKPLVMRPLITSIKPSRMLLARRKGVGLSDTAEQFRDLCRDAFGT